MTRSFVTSAADLVVRGKASPVNFFNRITIEPVRPFTDIVVSFLCPCCTVGTVRFGTNLFGFCTRRVICRADFFLIVFAFRTSVDGAVFAA